MQRWAGQGADRTNWDLRVDSSTIYKWVESKKLAPVIQLGGGMSLIRIPKSSLAHKIFKDGVE